MKSIDPSDIFRNFSGDWRLEREIPGMAQMVGKACFEPAENNSLNYLEAGRLTLSDGSVYEAHRRYVYRYEERQIAVYFADRGRDRELFHILDFPANLEPDGPVIADGHHHCGADHYRIRHKFLEVDTFEQEISVQGPRKDYRSFTRFKRHFPLAQTSGPA